LIDFGQLVPEKKIFRTFFVYFYSCYSLPLERGYPLPLKTFKFSLLKDDVCQVWLKLARGSGEKDF
jgi:hypothetical protein